MPSIDSVANTLVKHNSSPQSTIWLANCLTATKQMPPYWNFAKALNKVSHQRLLYKLHHYGIRGSTLNWIESFLNSQKQHVLMEGAIPAEAEVDSDVPQETLMGLLLFLAPINDHLDVICSLLDFFLSIKSIGETTILQQDFTALESWERDWHMSFHPEK
jgi:hypothetical protein